MYTPHRDLDLKGRTFGRLVVQAEAPARAGHRRWFCVCTCGRIVNIDGSNLASGRQVSCGCFRSEYSTIASTTHGATRGDRTTPEYRAWRAMRDRCTNPRNNRWPRYGQRGIVVCARWRVSFAAFLADMGPKPSPAHSLDRIDVNGHYEPGNCRWANRVEQANNRSDNRRETHAGVTRTVAQWARAVHLPVPLVHARLSRGWPLAKALTTPVGVREPSTLLARRLATFVASRAVQAA